MIKRTIIFEFNGHIAHIRRANMRGVKHDGETPRKKKDKPLKDKDKPCVKWKEKENQLKK